MKKSMILALALSLFSSSAIAQSYNDSILQFRKNYEEEFLKDQNSPLKASDLKNLRFYAPNIRYRVKASFTRTPEAKAFAMRTHANRDKTYRQYGILSFRINDTLLTLHIYQSIGNAKAPEDYLFIPFTDLTNYEETFAGGRYIDLTTSDLHNNEFILDFNKCYNPYCAYADGYACPIPPDENSLKVHIFAGEKLFDSKN
jgi:uncharacterized protein (DUF1684 family)